MISETLTVRENLLFSANVRLPRSISRRERVERVNQVLKDLDLQSCAETLIGTDFTRGVSGGEKKRTTIGMELVLSPNVLFLDEPTTGLLVSSLLFAGRLSLRRTRCVDRSERDELSVSTLSTRT